MSEIQGNARVTVEEINAKRCLITRKHLLPHHRRRDHFQHSAQAVVTAKASFIERRSRDGLPVIARSVVRERLRQARQSRVVLVVLTAKFVDHQIKRRDDEDPAKQERNKEALVSQEGGDSAESQGFRKSQAESGEYTREAGHSPSSRRFGH